MMIPLPFLIALIAVALFLREASNSNNRQANLWLSGFLGLFAFQEVLIGLRFGYGFEMLRLIQPFSAALIPPLAYLGFRRPPWSMSLLMHALPLIAVCVILSFRPGYLDLTLTIGNLFYAIALIKLGLRGSDALEWVEIRRLDEMTLLLWLVAGVLIVSGLTDVLIVYDYFRGNGSNTGSIAGWATAIGSLIAILSVMIFKFLSSSNRKPTGDEDEQYTNVFGALDEMMRVEKLHLDPDINLNRIARRMVLPTREVSRAVNQKTGNNVSQYVNQLRIEEACKLLQATNMPITQIVFAAGFNTKSNFNREFSRVMNTSPREWRTSN